MLLDPLLRRGVLRGTRLSWGLLIPLLVDLRGGLERSHVRTHIGLICELRYGVHDGSDYFDRIVLTPRHVRLQGSTLLRALWWSLHRRLGSRLGERRQLRPLERQQLLGELGVSKAAAVSVLQILVDIRYADGLERLVRNGQIPTLVFRDQLEEVELCRIRGGLTRSAKISPSEGGAITE